MQPIRVAPTSGQAEEWALVLTAAGIPNAIEVDTSGFILLAAGDDSLRAHAALAAYDDERRVTTTLVSEPYPWMSGVGLGHHLGVGLSGSLLHLLRRNHHPLVAVDADRARLRGIDGLAPCQKDYRCACNEFPHGIAS